MDAAKVLCIFESLRSTPDASRLSYTRTVGCGIRSRMVGGAEVEMLLQRLHIPAEESSNSRTRMSSSSAQPICWLRCLLTLGCNVWRS